MRSIRKLSLQNAAGQRFPLDGTDGVYVSDLAGFGFSLEPDFVDLGRGFFRPIESDAEAQQAVPFTITLTRNAYQTYRRFVDWLSSAGTLKMVYQPFGNAEYYRDVSINFVQKGELTAVRWLELPCSFFCLTPWYLPTPTALVLESSNGAVKRYPYRYTADLRYGSDSASTLSGIITPAGHIPGALDIAYTGELSNPRIRLAGNISGKTYGVCSVAVALSASDTLRFSTRHERSFVSKISAGGAETDLLDALDLNGDPFFRVPVDEPCTLSIESDSLITGKAQVLVYYYFRSV